jgi:hypothetical protein
MHILLCIIISTYKSPYGGARVAQTSGPPSGAARPSWHAVGGMLEPDKRLSRPFYITWVL